MSEPSLEQKFTVLCAITRAQHFAWREAVARMCPDVDPAAVTDHMWELTGVQTARSYLARIDPDKPLAPQVAASVVWSSQCMGEQASLEVSAERDEAHVRHAACPWLDWHRRLDLLAEDRPGCDRWFQSTVAEINRALGTDLAVETLEALPDGGCACVRRFWRRSDG